MPAIAIESGDVGRDALHATFAKPAEAVCCLQARVLLTKGELFSIECESLKFASIYLQLIICFPSDSAMTSP